jgi:hypothetical protein
MTEDNSSGRRDITNIGDTAIDRILAFVQMAMYQGDYPTAWENMLLLLDTPGNVELQDVGKELIIEKERQTRMVNVFVGCTPIEAWMKRQEFSYGKEGFLSQQCRKLYSTIMFKLKLYRYTEGAGYGPKTRSTGLSSLETKLGERKRNE